MDFKHQEATARGIKILLKKTGRKLRARICIYLITIFIKKPFGYMEDVLVDENMRGHGIGSQIINEVISEAKKQGCYKLICTSRHAKENVHKLYEKLGFKKSRIGI